MPVEEYFKMYMRYRKEPLTKEQIYRKIILEYEKKKRQSIIILVVFYKDGVSN